MTRSTTLHMDAFGHEALREYAETSGTSAAAVVRTAALYYLADGGDERPAWRVPRFARADEAPSAAPELHVDLDDDTWAAIEEEALRQQVTPGVLTRHAVLYFLADHDSGRLPQRLGDLLDGQP